MALRIQGVGSREKGKGKREKENDLSVSLPADSSPGRGAKADALSSLLAPLPGELSREA